MIPDHVICSLLERTINAFLRQNPDAEKAISTIAGKQIFIEISSVNLRLCLCPEKNFMRVEPDCKGEPDTCIKTTARALAKLWSTEGGQVSSTEGLEIKGDIEVVQVLRNVFVDIDIDWEEMLAQRVGDIAAHQIGNVIRAVNDWGQNARDSLRMDTTEYLQEESGLTPTRGEVEDFMDEVDTLRDDINRLEARVNRLITRQ